jgi:hypothetical protein
MNVYEMINQQRQASSAMGQQAAELAATSLHQMEGMAVEQRAELVRLSNSQLEPQNRQSIAGTALSGLHDVALQYRNFLGELAARQNVVTNNIDANDTATKPIIQWWTRTPTLN